MRALLRWFSLLLLFGPGPSLADDEIGVAETLVERAGSCSVTVCIPGRYELHYVRNRDFAIDANGTNHGVVDVGYQRWRIRPRVTFTDKLFMEMEADLVTGQVFGDQAATGGEYLHEEDAWAPPAPSDLRQFYVSWESPIGLFRIGHQTSHYGLGLVANNGDDEAHDVFDIPTDGDIVERALFATKPLKAFMDGSVADALILGGGFDLVFRDENAVLMDGDLAMQGVVSLMYQTEPLTAGVYMAFRNQEDDDGDTLTAQAYDLFVKWVHEFEEQNIRLTLAAEMALIDAHTNRAQYEQAPEGIDVLGMGAVLQTRLEWLDLGLETRLEVGFASGDNNRNDSLSRSFSFDPGYHVGMILFQEVMARISAHTVSLVSDPEISGAPPKGFELIATEGSVTNALYLNPIVRWSSTRGVGIDFGVLAAWAAADVIDPWGSAQNGGYNYNYLGKAMDDTSRYLGTEIDAAVHYGYTVRDAVRLRLGVAVGAFFPGSAFEAPEGGKSLSEVYKIRTQFGIDW